MLQVLGELPIRTLCFPTRMYFGYIDFGWIDELVKLKHVKVLHLQGTLQGTLLRDLKYLFQREFHFKVTLVPHAIARLLCNNKHKLEEVRLRGNICKYFQKCW